MSLPLFRSTIYSIVVYQYTQCRKPINESRSSILLLLTYGTRLRLSLTVPTPVRVNGNAA